MHTKRTSTLLLALLASFCSQAASGHFRTASTLRSTLLNSHHRTTCALPVVGKHQLGDASLPPLWKDPPLPRALMKNVKSGRARLKKDCIPWFCPKFTSTRCCGDTNTSLDNLISEKIDEDNGRSFIKKYRMPWHNTKCAIQQSNKNRQERQRYPRPTLCANDGVADQWGKRSRLHVCLANGKTCNRAYCNFDSRLCQRILRRSPAVRTPYKIFPIVFGIPSQAIVQCVPEKKKDFASVIPGYADATYSFHTQQGYYHEYEKSYFGFTRPKFGWDCFRHYEILASGSIPYFFDLERAPRQMLGLLPKKLLLAARSLPGVPILTYDILTAAALGNVTAKNMLKIDHSVFPKKKYFSLAAELLTYTKSRLAAHQVAKYVLTSSGNAHVLDMHQHSHPSVLYLSPTNGTGFIEAMMLHGLRSLLGSSVVDAAKQSVLYDSAGIMQERERMGLSGGGFGWAGLLFDDPSIEKYRNPENIRLSIKAHRYQTIIFDIRQCNLGTQFQCGLVGDAGDDTQMPFLGLVLAHYDRRNVIFIDGEDYPSNSNVEQMQAEIVERLGPLGNYFLREIKDGCPSQWTRACEGSWRKDIQGMPMYYDLKHGFVEAPPTIMHSPFDPAYQ